MPTGKGYTEKDWCEVDSRIGSTWKRAVQGALLTAALMAVLLTAGCSDKAASTSTASGSEASTKAVATTTADNPGIEVEDVSLGNVDWKALSGTRISSVAWSPNGHAIAFVATPTSDDYDADDSPQWAEIWTLGLSETGDQQLVKLARVTRGSFNIPTSSFWLSDDRIGWSGFDEMPPADGGWRLYCLSTSDGKVRQLTTRRFHLVQFRSYGSSYAPDDAYYDHQSGHLILSGKIYGETGGESSSVMAILYDVNTGTIREIPLDKGVCSPMMACGTVENGKPDFVIAADDASITRDGRNIIYLSHQWSLGISETIESSQEELLFPRAAPGWKQLAWVGYVTGGKVQDDPVVYGIYLYDCRAKSKQLIARLPVGSLGGCDPALGCPYAWSPKGDQIAYAAGSSVKLIRIGGHHEN